MPHGSTPLKPKQKNLDYVLKLFKTHETGIFSISAVIKQSKLTRTQTLRALEVLIEQGLVAKDNVKSVFYLL